MISRREASTGLLSSAVLAAAPGLAAENSAAIETCRRREPTVESLLFRLFGCVVPSANTRPDHCQIRFCPTCYGQPSASIGRRAATVLPPIGPRMVIEVYAAMEDGVWLYEPKTYALLPHLPDDIRTATGLQDFVGTAPLNLVYVAHGERMQDISAEKRRLYASVDTGFIGQNVYYSAPPKGWRPSFVGWSIMTSLITR